MKTFSTHSVQSVLAVAIIGTVFGIAYFLNPGFFAAPNVGAASTDNVSGYAWGENIGWISFNNTSDGSTQAYGVNINATSGNFSGHAWSSNIGWISFNHSEAGTPPAAPFNGGTGTIASYNKTTGKVTGWARALSACDPNCSTNPGAGANSGGWDGWIRFSDDSNTNWAGRGVTISNNLFSGYAWGDMVSGWIDVAPTIRGVFVGVRLDAPVCTVAIIDGGGGSWGVCQPLSQCTGDGSQTVPGVRVGLCTAGGTVVQSCNVSQTCTTVPVGTCGDGTCALPETLLTCPRDCKGNVKQF